MNSASDECACALRKVAPVRRLWLTVISNTAETQTADNQYLQSQIGGKLRNNQSRADVETKPCGSPLAFRSFSHVLPANVLICCTHQRGSVCLSINGDNGPRRCCFGGVLGFRGAFDHKAAYCMMHPCIPTEYRHYTQGESHKICGETKCFTLQRRSKPQTLVGI